MGKGEIMMGKALIYAVIGLLWVCTWFTGCNAKLLRLHTIVEIKQTAFESDIEDETKEVEEIEKSQEGELADENNEETRTSDSIKSQEDSSSAVTNAPETKPATPSTMAPNTSTPTTASSTTASTNAPETQPQTTVHVHSWVPVTTVVHHDTTYKTVWVQDSAAWDETVVTKEAWDEQVIVSEAWDEQVLIRDAYEEPIYQWVPVCNICGYQFPLGTTGDQLEYHIFDYPGCGGGWHDIQIQTGSTHHDAVYQTVHHDAVYQTIHHDTETTVIHHDSIGHNEQVIDQAAWDENVTIGYKCSGCGATK